MKRHSTDTVSLIFGLFFAGAAAWWLSGGPRRLDHSAAWFGIGALAIVGTVGVLTALFRTGHHDQDEVESAPAAE